jgi:hypothetical protein
MSCCGAMFMKQMIAVSLLYHVHRSSGRYMPVEEVIKVSGTHDIAFDYMGDACS